MLARSTLRTMKGGYEGEKETSWSLVRGLLLMNGERGRNLRYSTQHFPIRVMVPTITLA